MAEKVTDTYRVLSQAPSVVSGRLFGPNNAVVRFSQRNFDAQKIIRFLINYNFDIASDNVLSDKKNIKKSFPVDVSTEKLVSCSPTGRFVAVIRKLNDSTDTKQFLEIWSNDNLKNSVDIKALDVHGNIYTDDDFGSVQWSSQENKLAYIAEKKPPKTEAFYKRKPPPTSDEEDDVSKVSKGEEYLFKQDWGEQTYGKKASVIAVYDVDSDSVTIVAGIHDHLFPAQVIWGPNDSCLVGVTYHMEPRKLGIVYCSNRKSEIFHIDFQGHYKKLSEDGNAVRSPRFSPDFKYLLWLQRKTDKPHHACMTLMKMLFPVGLDSCTEVDEVIGLVEKSKQTTNNMIFFGMYNMSFPPRCWLNGGRKLVFSTCHQFQIKSYIVDIESSSLYELDFGHKNVNKSHTILDCDDNMIMIKRQHLFNYDSVIIGQVNDSKTSIGTWLHLTDDSKIIPGFENHNYEILKMLPVRKCKSTCPFNAIYVYPKESEKKSCPLIVWPHGGPHGISLNTFRMNVGVFASLNMAMLLVNYCGSIGAGQRSIDYLLQNVSKCDIEDCMSSMDYCLNRYSAIDPDLVFLYGGSYGGFLVAHLSGQFPNRFKAVVAINPVIDIASMALTSDIPDWCFAVANVQYSLQGCVSDDLLLKMRHLSPIQNIDNIKAPTLVLLGTKDLRVPHYQGLYYHYVLKANGVETKVYLYDDNHNLTKFNNEMDSVINSAIWFLEHKSK